MKKTADRHRTQRLMIKDWHVSQLEVWDWPCLHSVCELFCCIDGKMFGVWRCLLVSQKSAKDEGEDSKLLSAFRNLSEMQNWAVILAKGGHFAAACFERVKPPNPKSKGPLYKVKQHKTLHRYVIRLPFQTNTNNQLLNLLSGPRLVEDSQPRMQQGSMHDLLEPAFADITRFPGE